MNPHPAALPRTARPLWLLVLLSLLTWLTACSDSPPPAPVISVQPSDTSAVVGTAAILSVTASGPDIAYQWQLSTDGGTTWADVAGATQASHTTAATTPADNGRRYRVILSAAGISLTSSAVTLTVTAAVVAPALTVQPAAQGATAPAAATFSVTASGTAPGYQWQRSTDNGATWVNIAGATATSYSTGSTDVSMNASQYRVLVSNSAGSVTSTAAALSVAAAPLAAAFTTQPADQSVAAGSAAAFTLAATGNPTPTLQWQRSTDNGATWANIAAATDATYNTGLTTLPQNGERYRALASNSAGTAISNAVLLTVNAAPQAPAITTQPAAQSVTAPAAASFSVAATGVPAPDVQWQVSVDGGSNWANVVGATAAGYTTPATATSDNGKRYRAQISNASGTVVSQGAVLTVSAAPTGGAWQTAQALRPADGTSAERAVVAAGASGQFAAAWVDTDALGSKLLRASRYTPGSGWSVAETVAAVTFNTSATPGHALVMDAGGNAMLVFTALSNNRQSVWASRQAPSGPWSTPVLLETEDGGNAELPALAIDALGAATAVWQQNDTIFFPNLIATRRIVASRFVPSLGWEAPVDIDFASGGNGTGLPLHVAASPAGDVVAAWTGDSPAGQMASAAVRRAGAGWSGAQRLLGGTTPTTATTVGGAAINDAGVALVTFRQLPSVPSNVYAARYAPVTGWGTPVFLGPNGDAARVLLAPDGAAVVAWDSVSGNSIYAVRATAAGVWEAPSLVGGGFGTQIGRDDAGNVTLVFSDIPSPRRILSARWPAGGALGAAGVIESATTVPSLFSFGGLAVSAGGQAAAVWVEGSSPNAVPWVNVFR